MLIPKSRQRANRLRLGRTQGVHRGGRVSPSLRHGRVRDRRSAADGRAACFPHEPRLNEPVDVYLHHLPLHPEDFSEFAGRERALFEQKQRCQACLRRHGDANGFGEARHFVGCHAGNATCPRLVAVGAFPPRETTARWPTGSNGGPRLATIRMNASRSTFAGAATGQHRPDGLHLVTRSLVLVDRRDGVQMPHHVRPVHMDGPIGDQRPSRDRSRPTSSASPTVTSARMWWSVACRLTSTAQASASPVGSGNRLPKRAPVSADLPLPDEQRRFKPQAASGRQLGADAAVSVDAGALSRSRGRATRCSRGGGRQRARPKNDSAACQHSRAARARSTQACNTCRPTRAIQSRLQ